MKPILCLSLAVVVSFTALAADTPDTKALQGSWAPAKAELSGKPMPDAVLKSITLKIDNEKYEVTVTGEGSDQGTCKLDLASNPKGMTIISTNGANNGKTFPAIYELK